MTTIPLRTAQRLAAFANLDNPYAVLDKLSDAQVAELGCRAMRVYRAVKDAARIEGVPAQQQETARLKLGMIARDVESLLAQEMRDRDVEADDLGDLASEDFVQRLA